LSPTRFLIGIDGGGTRTRAGIATPDARIVAAGEAGPSALGQGIAQAWSNVSLAIERAFRAAGVAPPAPAECAIGLGLAGAIVATRRREFEAAAPAYAALELASDGYTMLLGAHAGGAGAVVAAGTGSIGEAIGRDGRHIVIGGWGYPVGDEGSGAWLGMRAVRETQRALDGRASIGPLVRSVLARTGPDRDRLLAWCETAGQHAYASLAPDVFATAARDPHAERLLAEAANALDGIARALDPSGQLPLVIAGSLGTRLAERLSPAVQGLRVAPAGDALDGALHLIRTRLASAGAAA
jgi:glucosamine kinase